MPELFGNFYFLLFGGITIMVVITILATAWTTTRQANLDADLKRDMIQRGMSAEDIERVIAASANSNPRDQPSSAQGISEDSLNEVVSVLGQVGASPEVIEEVLSVFRSADVPTQEAVSEAIQHLVESADEVTGEQIVAVVRALRQQKEAANTRLVPIHDERIKTDA